MNSVKLRFLLLFKQIVQMASLETSVNTIAIVWVQRFVQEITVIALKDVRLDGQEMIVNKVRQSYLHDVTGNK